MLSSPGPTYLLCHTEVRDAVVTLPMLPELALNLQLTWSPESASLGWENWLCHCTWLSKSLQIQMRPLEPPSDSPCAHSNRATSRCGVVWCGVEKLRSDRDAGQFVHTLTSSPGCSRARRKCSGRDGSGCVSEMREVKRNGGSLLSPGSSFTSSGQKQDTGRTE